MGSYTPLRFVPNLRTERPDATEGYTWGKPAADSNILRGLPRDWKNHPSLQHLRTENHTVSERWICSDDPALGSIVLLGDTRVPFRDLLDTQGEVLLGARHMRHFGPYLGTVMKLLDTHSQRQRGGLSVQVHPKGNHPTRPSKPEMWKGEGEVYIGWKEDMTPQRLADLSIKGTLEDYLHALTLREEDLLLVEGGLVHAIRSNSFLREWSKAPAAEDIALGNMKDATIALWDRTDGKQPRPGKENLPAAIDVMEHAQMLGAIDPQDLLAKPTLLSCDEAGNRHDILFGTPEVVVEQWTVTTRMPLDLSTRGLPLFVDAGVVHIFRDTHLLATLDTGSEGFLPPTQDTISVAPATADPCVLLSWHRPFPSID